MQDAVAIAGHGLQDAVAGDNALNRGFIFSPIFCRLFFVFMTFYFSLFQEFTNYFHLISTENIRTQITFERLLIQIQ